jgi:hypothetical protein
VTPSGDRQLSGRVLGYYPPNTWCYVNYTASYKWDIFGFYFPILIIASIGTVVMIRIIWKIWVISSASEADMRR